MSGVYIKSLEMPESCLDCKVHYVWGSGRPQCLITGEFIDDRNAYKQKRLEDCPLVPVPDHGRLIDADALYEGLVSNHPVVIHAKCAPTIIPASGKEGDMNT